MTRYCLNMIVKNEAARIERALSSVSDVISGWVVCDTGSSDNTVEVIKKFFAAKNIPGEIVKCTFENWAQARNYALIAGRVFARKNDIDYLLLMDADMQLVVSDKNTFLADKTAPSYDMYQYAGALHYQNRRMVRTDVWGEYFGVTHEFLGVDTGGCIPENVAFFLDHADGANRPDKSKRDIKLLKDGLKKEPNNERYFYYLAQSYRDAGKTKQAAEWYKKRVDVGGWDEEVWSAQCNYAQCLKDLGNEAGFIRELQVAYNMRPSRAESLYDLAKHFRETGKNAVSLLYSETGMKIPHSGDALFVNDFVYECGCKDEFSICAFYMPNRRQEGFEVCNELSLKKGPYSGSREMARTNLYHYLQPLKEILPSFEWRKIEFTAPDGYTNMNPSITTYRNQLHAIIRSVNYRIDEHGRYLIRGDNGEANNTNPIRTRNFLAKFDTHLNVVGAPEEVLPPGNMPCEFPPVVGFEDMRLFSWDHNLWVSSTVRQIHPDGLPEQVLARIDPTGISEYKRMLRMPRACEKNWMPISNGSLRFMHRLDTVVDTNGNNLALNPVDFECDHISGGSQVIPFPSWEDGYLCVVHEARHVPGKPTRFYSHRFVWLDKDLKFKRMTLPFYFHEKGIEYVAGMTMHPTDPDKLVVSYGFKDEEARLGTFSVSDLEKVLCKK